MGQPAAAGSDVVSVTVMSAARMLIPDPGVEHERVDVERRDVVFHDPDHAGPDCRFDHVPVRIGKPCRGETRGGCRTVRRDLILLDPGSQAGSRAKR